MGKGAWINERSGTNHGNDLPYNSCPCLDREEEMKSFPFPCKGCEKRHEGCHNECAGYLEIKAQSDAARQKETERKNEERVIGEYICDSKLRYIKSKIHKG